ncbi:MAG: hypothetical protein HY344_01340 [Candidatus Levybacteria bacterium]|nr:hypothetical protein [Candidatus Levybacteria bacterium]
MRIMDGQPTDPNMPGAGQPVVPPVQTPVEPNVPAEDVPAVPPAPEPQAPGAGEPAPEEPVSNPNPGQWTPPAGGDQGNGAPAA